MNHQSSRAWVTCFETNPQARLRLFCFPYAGRGASVYRSWAKELPKDVEVCAIQPPGRETRHREPPITHLSTLIQMLLPALRVLLDRPFAFYGHSMGGLLSFEAARQLRRLGAPAPQCLFISSSRAPQLSAPHPSIHDIPDPAFIAELNRRFNGIPPEIANEPTLLKLFVPLLRADIALLETYKYSPDRPLDCPIFAFGGTEDQEVSPESLDGWRVHTNHSYTSRRLAGGHFFLNSQRPLLLQHLSRDLRALLAKFDPRYTSLPEG
jgi:medium-chain acyl-[acyl-carrier-protein] hydrolase